MRTLLITDNLKVANFIKQGLYYEDIYPEILLFDREDREIEAYIHNYNLILIQEAQGSRMLTLIKLIRSLNPGAKIFMLGNGFSNVNLFTLKAEKTVDDVFLKPLQFKVIANRVRNVIYNLDVTDGNKLIHRDILMNLDSRELFFKDVFVPLRNKEFALLHYLILNKGKLLSRMMILENVWDSNANIFTNTVDVHISRLRKVLKNDENEPPYIQTVPCSGYIFT